MDGPIFGCGWYDVIVGIEDEDRPVFVNTLPLSHDHGTSMRRFVEDSNAFQTRHRFQFREEEFRAFLVGLCVGVGGV